MDSPTENCSVVVPAVISHDDTLSNLGQFATEVDVCSLHAFEICGEITEHAVHVVRTGVSGRGLKMAAMLHVSEKITVSKRFG